MSCSEGIEGSHWRGTVLEDKDFEVRVTWGLTNERWVPRHAVKIATLTGRSGGFFGIA